MNSSSRRPAPPRSLRFRPLRLLFAASLAAGWFLLAGALSSPGQVALQTLQAFGEPTPILTGDPQPNLTPFRPSGWSDKIVVAKVTGTTTDAALLLPTDILYVDWALINSGAAATGARFFTELLVDGVSRSTWFSDPPLNPSFYAFVTDYSIGSLPVGTHTIRIRTDSTSVIEESDETDNDYTKTVVIKSPAPEIRVEPLTLSFGSDSNSAPAAGAQVLSPRPPALQGAISIKTGRIQPPDPDAPSLGGNVPGVALPRDTRHALVRFRELPSAAGREALGRRGITLLRYVADGAYWAALEPGASAALAEVREAGGVRLAMASASVDKLAPEGRSGRFPQSSVEPNGDVIVEVLFFEDVSIEAAEAAAVRAGAAVRQWVGGHTARVGVPFGRLGQIAALDEVEWVQPAPGPKIEYNSVSAVRIHAFDLAATPYNLTGAGVTVGVWDGGRVGAHPDFGGRMTVVDTAAAVSAHATHVAGTIGGSGAGSVQAKGMAPGVFLRSYDWDNDSVEMRAGAGSGVRLSNHSYGYVTGWSWEDGGWVDYGSDGFGTYGATASEWDDVVFDTGLIVFKAAGNDRNNGPDYPYGPRMDGPYDSVDESGCGKNVITVGATTDSDGMTAFSSWGPANDGRVKPDLCANGEGLYSTLPNGAYGWMSGTSMATPSACGAAALLSELYTAEFAFNLRPDTCKALLIQGATDSGPPGPDYQYGWGLIHAKNSADLLQNRRFRLGTVSDASTVAYTVTVSPGTAVLKATLAWTDPAGSPLALAALVNNLDLVLTNPAGAIVRPWVLNPAAPGAAATQGVNNQDNAEQVLVNNPAPGLWTLAIQGAAVPFGPQDFTLVCEHLPAQVANHAFTVFNDGGADLSVNSLALDAPADFIQWSPAAPFIVPPGSSRTVNVSVNLSNTPPGGAVRRLLLESNDADESPYPGGINIEIQKPSSSSAFVRSVTPGTARRDFTGFVGARIQIGASPLTVLELGRLRLDGNSGTHLLKLVNAATGADVPGGSVSITMTPGPSGSFQYAALAAPVTLNAGAIYHLASREENGRDYWMDVNTQVTTTAAGFVLGGVYGSGGAAWMPYGGAGRAYGPLDFKYTSAEVPRTLSLNAAGLLAGVALAVSPGDNAGLGDGTTPFARVFNPGTLVSVSAPASAEGKGFAKWLLDGGDYSAAPATNVVMNADHELTAVYESTCESPLITSVVPGTLRNNYPQFVGMRLLVGPNPLRVTRLGRMMAPGNSGTHLVKLVRADTGADVPGGSASITMAGGTPGQFKYGALATAVTLGPFTTYYLVSKEAAGGDQWHDVNSRVTTTSAAAVLGGAYGTGPGAWFAPAGEGAAYGPVDLIHESGCGTRTLQVASMNPSSGVEIGISPADNSGASNGFTAFERLYPHGTVVTLTAPATAAGNVFSKWQRDGSDVSTELSATVSMDADRAMTAVYAPAGGGTSFVTGTTLGTLRNDYGDYVGMRVTMNQNATVTRLGRIMVAGNTGSHMLKIINAATGLAVPGGSVTVAMTGGEPGAFKYAALPSPVTLLAGATYYFVSLEQRGGDYWHDLDTVITTTGAGSVLGGIYASGAGAWRANGGAGRAYVPVDFQYEASGQPSLAAFVTSRSLGALRNDYGGFVGMKIDIGPAPVTVFELGRMMAGGNSGAHLVKFVSAATGQDVPGAAITLNMAGGTAGEFKYAALAAPVGLAALTSYYLVSQEYSGGDLWHDITTQMTSSPAGSIISGVYGTGPGAWRLYGGAGHGYVPLDFRYASAGISGKAKNVVSRAGRDPRQTGATILCRVEGSETAQPLQLLGIPGKRYRLETSGDLKIWKPIAVLENEVIEVDAGLDGGPQRFYRLAPDGD